jgi:putative spermidine/putrescine transport system permease protein
VTRIRWTNGWLLLPALAWLGILFVYPIGRLFYASVFTPAFSLSSYGKLLGTSVYAKVFANTFEISATVTLLALVLGYPLAFVLATAGPRTSRLMLGAIIVPLWTSVLVRTYAWMVLLGRRGLVNEGLLSLGLLDAPLPLLYNRLGVTIGMVHVLLPFMVLPIYSVLIAIPRNLVPAAASLGAGPIRAFVHILLPLTLRGIASGALLVFMAALGYYITPALIGGPKDQMISSVIAFYATGSANWGMAGALGIVLLAATLVLYGIYGRLSAANTARG